MRCRKLRMALSRKARKAFAVARVLPPAFHCLDRLPTFPRLHRAFPVTRSMDFDIEAKVKLY
jgi:hypothetical protein